MRVCVFEDEAVVNLDPLTASRPAFDLRCGATTLLQKQCRLFGAREVAAMVRPSLAGLCRLDHPELHINETGWSGGGNDLIALVNARWLPGGEPLERPVEPMVGMAENAVAFLAVPAGEVRDLSADSLAAQLRRWTEAYPQRPAGGRLLGYPWHLVECNAQALADDFLPIRNADPAKLPPGLTLAGPAERLWIHPSARVEPFVLINTTTGPVMIDREAVVQAYSRLDGPCYIGPQTQVLGARVHGGSFGPQCRIGGEIEASIVAGYSNKAHDGFLGHSYLGEWVNFAAGTITSDLRADYAPVRFTINGQSVDSGLLKAGSFVGDHVKTSLGVLFNTGSRVGPFSTLLTAGALLPRHVPAFCRVSHGRMEESEDVVALFRTAAVMMSRRGREWTPAHAEFYRQLHASTAPERTRTIADSEQRRMRPEKPGLPGPGKGR